MGNFSNKQGDSFEDLDETLMKVFRRRTGLEEDEIRREHGRFFALAKNGCLKKKQLEDLLSDQIMNDERRTMKKLVNCVFDAIDVNHDGSIDFVEYLMSRSFFGCKSTVEKAVFVFGMIDRDADQRISKRELKAVLKLLQDVHKNSSSENVQSIIGIGVKSTVNSIFQEFDQDESGYIDRNEFIDGWLKNQTIRDLFTF